jgi:hypothetical protein
LKRELSGGSSEIISGKIKIENGRQIEEVVIRKGTPGAFLFSPRNDRFAISFEEDGDSRWFGPLLLGLFYRRILTNRMALLHKSPR